MPIDNLLQDITDRVMGDAIAAKEFFRLTAKPNATWLKKIEPGVNASQRLVDELLKAQPAPDVGVAGSSGPPSGDDADFNLEPADAPVAVAPPAPVAPPPMPELDEMIAKLKTRLRVPADADARVVLSAVLQGGWNRKAMMLTPLALPVLPWVHFAHLAQIRTQPWLGYFQETDTVIQKARNLCAHNFLASEAEWSWWVDGDIVPSWGDVAFFYDLKKLGIPQSRISQDFLKTKTLERLLSHGKTVVGAVYQQRRVKGAVCAPADLRPNPTPEEKDAVLALRQKGPRDKLLAADWCATGCLLVHRSVYDDIKRKRPDLAPPNEGGVWNFFGHEVGRGGEDAAFGALAKEAGHQSYLDLGAWVAHVGNYAFMPEAI